MWNKWKLNLYLEGVEQEITEEANEAQNRAFRNRFINDKGEEDGMNPKQGNESQGRFCQSGKKEKGEANGISDYKKTLKTGDYI